MEEKNNFNIKFEVVGIFLKLNILLTLIACHHFVNSAEIILTKSSFWTKKTHNQRKIKFVLFSWRKRKLDKPTCVILLLSTLCFFTQKKKKKLKFFSANVLWKTFVFSSSLLLFFFCAGRTWIHFNFQTLLLQKWTRI